MGNSNQHRVAFEHLSVANLLEYYEKSIKQPSTVLGEEPVVKFSLQEGAITH